VSKPSRRPGREAIKEQKKARKKAQRQLRQRQKEQGLSAPAEPGQSNRTCPYQTQEEERAARVDAVSQQVKVYRAMLPVLLKRLSVSGGEEWTQNRWFEKGPGVWAEGGMKKAGGFLHRPASG